VKVIDNRAVLMGLFEGEGSVKVFDVSKALV
jgi:hypothetical protein